MVRDGRRRRQSIQITLMTFILVLAVLVVLPAPGGMVGEIEASAAGRTTFSGPSGFNLPAGLETVRIVGRGAVRKRRALESELESTLEGIQKGRFCQAFHSLEQFRRLVIELSGRPVRGQARMRRQDARNLVRQVDETLACLLRLDGGCY